jgi:branched-subunit amino acid transport protein
MTDKTTLVMPGQKLSVPRFVKRIVQIAASCALTAAVALILVVGSGMLLARGSSSRGLDTWLAFVRRPDIQGTVLLTAIVSVLFVYWQRDRERGR